VQYFVVDSFPEATMLSIPGLSGLVLPTDGRFDETREARADARFGARLDARAVYVCRPRLLADVAEPQLPEDGARWAALDA
jgi:hypothetical protein